MPNKKKNAVTRLVNFIQGNCPEFQVEKIDGVPRVYLYHDALLVLVRYSDDDGYYWTDADGLLFNSDECCFSPLNALGDSLQGRLVDF